MVARTISADFPGTLFLATVIEGSRDSMAADAAEEGVDPPGKVAIRSSLFCRCEVGDDAVDPDPAPVLGDPPLLFVPPNVLFFRINTCKISNYVWHERRRRRD